MFFPSNICYAISEKNNPPKAFGEYNTNNNLLFDSVLCFKNINTRQKTSNYLFFIYIKFSMKKFPRAYFNGVFGTFCVVLNE